MVLQDGQYDQGVCASMMLYHVNVGVQAEHLLEAVYEGLLVQPVGLLADAVDEGPIHICTASQH
jgi:hypothetical protein